MSTQETILDALRAAWNFIENVTEEDPNRTEKFFELRAQVRGAFSVADCNFTGNPSGSLLDASCDTPSAGPADLDEIIEATRNLIDAAKLIAERWESGNLADAVQNLQMTASFAEYTFENVAVEVEPQSKNVTSWDYHQHGQHAYFTTEEWHTDVAESGTILGYQAWVEQKLEEMLHETDLDGIDSIEIAGCTEHDGIVEVITEGDAEFFSVYTHRQNMGVECICDFNNKAQALEFAKALAGRAGLPIYGNQCSIEEETLHVK